MHHPRDKDGAEDRGRGRGTGTEGPGRRVAPTGRPVPTRTRSLIRYRKGGWKVMKCMQLPFAIWYMNLGVQTQEEIVLARERKVKELQVTSSGEKEHRLS